MNAFSNSLLAYLFVSPIQAIVLILALVVAITFHEFAHAWTADRLGDDTPRLMGRVTLSPLAHLDPIGSLCMLLFTFGWGKPVIYNPMRLSRKSDELLIALAGPASNLLLAIIFNALNWAGQHYGIQVFNSDILQVLVDINVLLAAFNMIPIPPLDGSSIIAFFWPEYRSLVGGQVGLLLLLLLIFTNSLAPIIGAISGVFAHVATLFGILS